MNYFIFKTHSFNLLTLSFIHRVVRNKYKLPFNSCRSTKEQHVLIHEFHSNSSISPIDIFICTIGSKVPFTSEGDRFCYENLFRYLDLC